MRDENIKFDHYRLIVLKSSSFHFFVWVNETVLLYMYGIKSA